MGHKIEAIDLALGTVQRHENELPSWHGLETVKAGLSTDNCALREMNVVAANCKVEFNGQTYESDLSVPAIAHPIDKGKVLFLGKPHDAESYALFTPAAMLDFAAQCFAEAGLDKTLAFTTTLFEGSRMTIAKHIPEADFKDAYGQEVRSYFNLLNSMDGSWPVFANISEIRTVCFNTASWNLAKGGASTKHRPDALNSFIKSFPSIFAEAIKEHKGSENDYLAMAHIPFTKDDAVNFFAALLTSGEKKMSKRTLNTANDDLLPLFIQGRGNHGQNAADAYNAITEYYTHEFSAEANAPGGTADNRKREARIALTSPNLREMIERGKELIANCPA